MSKSLADLRANPTESRPERALTICLVPHLVAEVQALTDELRALVTASLSSVDDEDRDGPPKRVGQGRDPREDEINARLAELIEEMADNEGELRLRATPDGDWRRWVNEHPARQEGEPGYDRDQQVALGYCNADDLIDDLATYAYTWDGDPLIGDDWATLLEPKVSGADKKDAAKAVVTMQETRLDFRQWRSALSATLRASNASASQPASKSPRAGSTAGRPRKSSAATTKKASKSPSRKPG